MEGKYWFQISYIFWRIFDTQKWESVYMHKYVRSPSIYANFSTQEHFGGDGSSGWFGGLFSWGQVLGWGAFYIFDMLAEVNI